MEDLKFANSLTHDPNFKITLTNQIVYKSGFFTQFNWLMWRSFLSMLRDPFSTKIAIFQTIVRFLKYLIKTDSKF